MAGREGTRGAAQYRSYGRSAAACSIYVPNGVHAKYMPPPGDRSVMGGRCCSLLQAHRTN